MQSSDLIGRRIKLQDLRILMTVAQAGSMRKAAGVLHASQPAISRSIAELEDAVGVRLLDRNPQGVAPTAYGRALIDGAAAIFDELHQAVRNIEFLTDPTAGEVRIGSIVPLAATFVSAVVDRLARRHPRMVFHFLSGGTDSLHDYLHARKVDLLIARRYGAAPDERENFEFLFDDPYVVVAGAKSPWAHRRRITLPELIDETWALPPPESPPWSIAMEAFRAAGAGSPRATVLAGPPEVRMSLLATGHFLSIFPASAMRFPARRSELKVLPVELPGACVQIGIVTLKDRTLSPVARLFIEHTREVSQQLAER
jgi:DNA-binding transcriptional LysR family regulator